MGKHSGSAALRKRLADLGFSDLPKEQLNDIFKRFKKVLQPCMPRSEPMAIKDGFFQMNSWQISC